MRDGGIACLATTQHLGRTTHLWAAVITAEATGRTIALFRFTQWILWPET